jgi:hypothetical protein
MGDDTQIMSVAISVPEEWVESVSELKFPASTDARLQWLMDRNNDKGLDADERLELKALVEMSEELSLVRARAMQFLNRLPN